MLEIYGGKNEKWLQEFIESADSQEHDSEKQGRNDTDGNQLCRAEWRDELSAYQLTKKCPTENTAGHKVNY